MLEESEEINNHSKVGFSASTDHRDSGGVAYVFLPSDIERSIYIRDCYLNNWISVYIEGESIVNRVHISSEVLSFIEFPLVQGEFGSCVVWILDHIKKQIVIVCKLVKYDEVGSLEENTFSFGRKINNTFVEIRGNSQKNYLNLLLVGDSNNTQINIVVRNQGKLKSILNIESDGLVKIKAADKVDIQSGNIILATLNKDNGSVITQTPESINLDAKRVKIGDGDQSAMLGNIWNTFMEAFIDELGAITISTPQGQMPILNKDKVLKLKNRLQDILSDILFIE